MKTKITNYCLKCGGKMKLQGGGNGFNTASNLMNTAGDIANMFPGVGTAIGAGLKGLSFVSDMFAKRQAVKDNQNLIAKNDRNIPIYQSNESVYPNPNQNMMQTGGVPTQGGVIQPVSSTGSVALGQTHDEGGIKYAPNIEVENKEGIHNVDDKTVVSSNVLKNPLTGKSFASEMVGLEKQKGDLEIDLKKELDKSKGKSTYTSIMLKKRIDELEVKIGELYEQQEALASKMGLRDEQGNPNQMSQQVVGNEEQIQNMQQQVMKQQAGGNIKRIDPINGKEYFLNKDNKMVDSDGNIVGKYYEDNNGYLNSNLHNYTPVKLINSNHITTKNMAFPIEANGKVLYPNTGDYYFKKKPVVEKPLNFKSGGTTKIGTDFNDIDALNSEFHKYNIPLKIENKNTIYVNNERKYFPNGIDDNIIKELLTPFNSTNLIEDYQSGGNLSYPEAIVDSKYLKNRTSKYELGKTEFKEDKKSTKSPFRGEELFSYGTQIAGSLLPMVMPLKKTELNYYDEGKGYGYLNNAYRSALLYPKKMEELSNYNLNRDLAQYSQALTNNGSNMNRTPMLQNLYAEGRSKANDLIANSQAKSLELQTASAESIYNKDRSKYLTNQEINAQNDNFANNYLATKYINPLSKLSESTVQQLEAKRNYIEETTKNNKIAGYELVYNPETGRHEYIRINSNAKGLTNTPSNKLQSIPVPNLKLETPDYKLNK